ncbi:hypothetical protein [Tenacibaculum sp. 190524A05c]|uniref:Lipocalin-like domain-containing protein n=1 Tax=Tenacibaculum platacis TaxID=3137852 RepID=A0ABM9P4D3_9FLAO
MKIRIYSIIGLISILLATIMMSCSEKDEIIINSKLEGYWKVVYYIENGNKITTEDYPTWPEFNNGEITLNFMHSDVENNRGSISGKTVTNSINGTYTIKENNKISFSVFTTLINEPEWTKLFKINQVENYAMGTQQLLLNYDNTSIVLERISFANKKS